MRIGELSQRTGVSVRMLRYYESKGLLSPARLASGYRIYGWGDVETVERIAALNAAGLPLDAILRVLPCAKAKSRGFRPCVEVQQNLRQQIDHLDRQIAKLSESRRVLSDYLTSAT